MTVTIAFEMITPKKAAAMLAHLHPMQAGRHHQNVINAYAKSMRDGTWDIDVAQTIQIDELGQLINGYHRLNAVVASGKTMRLAVARGGSPKAFEETDAAKSRSQGFRLGMPKDDIAAVAIVYRCFSLGSRVNMPDETARVIYEWMTPIRTRFAKFATVHRARRTASPIRGTVLMSALRHPDHEDAIFAAYHNFSLCNFADAPRSMTALFRRVEKMRMPVDLQIALSWRAFDPRRFNADKIQINATAPFLQEIRREVLRDLCLMLGEEE